MNAHRWNGLVLASIAVIMVHQSTATNAGRNGEPWPALLSSEPVADPAFAMLHQRANGSLEKLVQAAGAPDRPL